MAESLQILYGGSMNPGNAAELMANPDIDGGLILIQHGKGADAGVAFGSGASATVFGASGSASVARMERKRNPG